MKLDEILAAAGTYKKRKRVGRGTGSGHGKTSGRGHKGYGSRSGAKRRANYEGGQATILSRSPKRGFNNANFTKRYQIVNLSTLQEAFADGETVNVETLAAKRIVDAGKGPVKILGDGEFSRKLTVQASKFSASAREKIAQAGGTVEEV